jgi:hypothetical protein
MSVVFLITGALRDVAMREAITAKGWQIDSERSAFSDPEVIGWHSMDPPCVVKVHDGRAVWECSDPVAAAGWSWNWVKGEHTKAVKAYDTAKAEAP